MNPEQNTDAATWPGVRVDPHVRQPIENDVWSISPPSHSGTWWMRCGEAEGEPELVFVEWRCGELWAVDCDFGSLPVRDYHNGLTNCMWQVA